LGCARRPGTEAGDGRQPAGPGYSRRPIGRHDGTAMIARKSTPESKANRVVHTTAYTCRLRPRSGRTDGIL